MVVDTTVLFCSCGTVILTLASSKALRVQAVQVVHVHMYVRAQV